MSKPSTQGQPNSALKAKGELRFRREILISAQQLMQRIDEWEDDLERFREQDLPRFTEWHATCFAREKEQIANLEQELNSAVQLHNSVVALSKMRGVSMAEAYRLIREEQTAYLNGTPARRRRIEEEREQREIFIRDDLEREFQERVAASIATEIQPVSLVTAGPAAMDEERLKLVYRKLVRRLHPDMQGPVPDASEMRWQKRIWHLSQQARQAGDVRQLESLYKVSLLRQMELSELTISDAQEVQDWLRKEAARLEGDWNEARSQQAWSFSLLEDYYELKLKIAAGFEQERRFIEGEIAEIRGQHAFLEVVGCSDAVQALKRKNTRRASNSEQLSLFDL